MAPAAAKKAAATKAAATKAAATKAAPTKKAPPAKAAPKKAAAVKKAPVTQAKAPAKAAAAKTTKAPATKAAPAPAKKAPAAKVKSPFSAKWLAGQKQALLDERVTYLRQADNLQAEADALVADYESGDVQFDEESGEGDTLNIERARDLTLSAQARAAVDEIDHALAKFDLGTYGICETSGDPIPTERLEAIPWARQQVQYKAGGLGRR